MDAEFHRWRSRSASAATPRARISVDACDSVSLYSGGLDSAIGMLNLRAQGRNPVLVSHAYSHDASRQDDLIRRLGVAVTRFGTIANPAKWWDEPNDVQMRTRSFNFLALGTLMAATLASTGHFQGNVTLHVPENGLIAINPPLTNRRIGALSTRTTHPYFLSLIQSVLATVGIPVQLANPFAHSTKGEMLAGCLDPQGLGQIAHHTVSCSKWKRSGKQCGRCVPCLIRRASFHAAGWQDKTDYDATRADLGHALAHETERDDLMAMILAARRLPTTNVANWIGKTGPMPSVAQERAALVDVVGRGMMEVRAFLDSEQLL